MLASKFLSISSKPSSSAFMQTSIAAARSQERNGFLERHPMQSYSVRAKQLGRFEQQRETLLKLH